MHLTLVSNNAKTGPIPVSTSLSSTCPQACPLKASGKCYAKSGPLAIHWRKVDHGRGGPFASFLDMIRSLPLGQLWRHNQAGDLPGVGNRINGKNLKALTKANKGRRGFTYTHKPVLGSSKQAGLNRRHISDANAAGFTVNLSADSLADADAKKALGIAPVVVVLRSNAPETQYTPGGNKVIVCPAQSREGIQCATCGLCQRRDRSVIVGFRAHGASHKSLSASLSN